MTVIAQDAHLTAGAWAACGLTKHEATFSSLNISRRTYCSGYDEHACDTIFFLILETEESISEIVPSNFARNVRAVIV